MESSPIHRRLFSIVPDHYPLDTSSPVVSPQTVFACCQKSFEIKITMQKKLCWRSQFLRIHCVSELPHEESVVKTLLGPIYSYWFRTPRIEPENLVSLVCRARESIWLKVLALSAANLSSIPSPRWPPPEKSQVWLPPSTMSMGPKHFCRIWA